MNTSMLVRLKPHDPKKGLLLKQYTYQGIRFQAGRGWYKVNGQVAAYLESVHSVPGDNDTPLAFDVCTPDEARAMDEKDRKAARQVVPAEQALDVSHVGDAQPRAKSRPSTDRDDAPRRQRRDSDRMPDSVQPDTFDDEDMEDETPRRRPSRRRAGAVSRRPRAVVEDFGELDDGDDPEDDDVEDEAPRRWVRRGCAGGVPRRRLWAEDEELDDVEPGDEVDEFDGDELDDELEDTPPLAHRRCSLSPRSRVPRARPIQWYAVEHGALDDDDRQIRRVRGPRQAEALDALRNREARRMRRQHTLDDRYEELPRSRSQGQYQDEPHIRHARQMAAKLEEIDALDDAMSHGDAEDSLPHRRKQQDAPSSRHTADAQDDLDAVEQALDHRNVEEPARSDARSQRAQQPPSSAAHDELNALDDALDDDLDKASEDRRPGSAQPHARSQRAQQLPSSAAHDELDALDDALDDDLDKASEDQRPGSAQPQHGQQRTGSSTQYGPEGAHGATSGADARHEGQPWPDDDPFVNRDTCHQGAASGRELVAAASASARQGRRTDMGMQNSHARDHPDTPAAPAIRDPNGHSAAARPPPRGSSASCGRSGVGCARAPATAGPAKEDRVITSVYRSTTLP